MKEQTAVKQVVQRFNYFYSRNDLPETKDGVYVMNLEQYRSVGTHCRHKFPFEW